MRNLLNSTQARVTAVFLSILAVFAMPSAAFADTAADNTAVSGAISDQFSSLTSTVTTVLVPALFGLVILGVLIALGVKYIKKGARQA